MPMFDFECEKCHKVKEIIVKFDDAEKPQPCDCEEGALMQRVDKIYAPGHQYKGRWMKTAGSY